MPETARNNDAHGRQQLKLITAVGVVILVGFAGVVAWQQWPTGGGHLEPDLKPLDTFMDCLECPEMVMIPGGIFTMGSPVDDRDHQPQEGPQHRVTIAPFAMGKTEVTFAEWDTCVIAGDCNGYKPADEGWGGDHGP